MSTPRCGRLRRLADTGLIVIFVLGIGLPLAGSFFRLELTTSLGEKRPESALPEVRLKRAFLTVFPARFEAFYNDRFGLRNTLIHCLNVARLRWFGMSSSRHVVVGQEGWLYYTQEPIGTNYGIERPFTDDELAAWQGLLERRRDWLARRAIRYLFVIAPDKQSIYPEYLPPALGKRVVGPTRLDQLVEHLGAHSSLTILDLRPSLLAARAEGRLYHRTDSHWNEHGARIGYQQILNALAAWLPDLRAWPRSAFESRQVRFEDNDLAGMLGLKERFSEDRLVLVPLRDRQAHRMGEVVPMTEKYRLGHLRPLALECVDPELPRAVVFHDSFGEYLVDFLAEHFRRSVFAPADVFDASLVERERPDVVIQQMVERKLYEVLPADPRLEDEE